jgi:hypothetical protein
MAESVAQLRWQELEAQLPVEIIEMPYYAEAERRCLCSVLKGHEVPDWVYQQDIEFMIQQNW